MRKRRIIGIDPGLAHTGFGIVDALGEQKRLVSYGIIETAADDDQGTRLLAIHNRLVAILQEFRPDEASME
ncbi:MAG: crossover junction endodeoxyribonuclease RuvC, partial [Treponemataceae bacterium]|nr:crossover junction endodeoxyribonuclease RuvC [Treponemataceae bacterium]